MRVLTSVWERRSFLLSSSFTLGRFVFVCLFDMSGGGLGTSSAVLVKSDFTTRPSKPAECSIFCFDTVRDDPRVGEKNVYGATARCGGRER